ncbi:MAG TPA: transglycosylase SLT domain-containing protein [Thermoanaerobaculia bacterium]|nr:transglycosylase SLT domain-containing protein [Thermoanaerobaculia bacterium]
MNDRRWLLPAAVLLCASCAGTTPAPLSLPPAHPSAVDRDELRRDLEAAFAGIAAREQGAVPAVQVDFEAAASIEIPQHATIDGALQYFGTALQEKIQASLLRSSRYRKMIDQTLEDYRLPKALAYLPVIESAFIPTLTSRAGAHGLWQIMPDTAREYGLRIDWWIDERADPELSTRAAAEFLNDLYRQFGDWPLALAAYNCGPGRVRRAMKSTGATTFWELLEKAAVPRETRGYVPTFYATLRLAADPEAHGFRLDPPAEEAEERIEIEGPLSFHYLAEVAGIEERELRELNPSLHRGLIPPGASAVKVPAAVAPLVAAQAATMKHDDPQLAVAAFTLRRGDTVAKLARRIGTTPETILAMNGLSPNTPLRAGRAIFLPVQARRLGALLRHADDDEVFYTVRKGDTLYSIARRHQLTVTDIRELNDLGDDVLQPGQKLRVSPPRGLTAGSM